MKKYLDRYRGELIYALSSYSTPLVTMVTNVISAAFLKPEELGTIQSVLILLPYLAFMHFGVFNGLNRNIAFYKAKGQEHKVQQMVNASHTMAVFNAGAGALIGVGYLIYFIGADRPVIYFYSALLLILNLLLNPFIVHYETTFRSSQNFKTLGKITFAENLLYAIANLLPIWIGYLGKVIANGMRVLSRFFFRHASRPYSSTGWGKLADIAELVKVGSPLLIGAYLMGIILVSDQTLIVSYLGPEKLGLYSLSVFLMTAMVVIPTSLNTLLYPRAAAAYGRTGDASQMRGFYWKALALNSAIIVPLCAVLYFAIPPLTATFLPRYISGVPAARINLLTCLTFVSNGPSVIIGVLRRNIPLLAAYCVSLIFIWITGILWKDQFHSIEQIAWLRFYISAFLSVFTLIYSFILTGRRASYESRTA